MEEILQLHRAYRSVFDGVLGQKVLKDIERRGCFERSTFSTDPGRTVYNEGRRSMVLHVRFMLDENNFKEIKEPRGRKHVEE